MRLTANGCLICGTDLYWSDRKHIEFTEVIINGTEQTYDGMCPDCVGRYIMPAELSGTEQ